ncbi:hypothetical protein QYF36_004514 [Acer negundo]|nr:hypothetical protein QYF36_004514 [Acer negundo]
MDNRSRNRRRVTENHLLRILVFFLLQYHLWISLSFVNATSNVYIVYMGVKKYEDPATTTKSHHKILSTLLGSKDAAKDSILYSYKHGFSGFAARLTKTEAEKVAELPGVVQVMPNQILKLHTTRSWEFIGLNSHSSDNLLTESNMGEGTIIGVIDTGVWPESESFNDNGIGPVPSHWKGICQEGEQAFLAAITLGNNQTLWGISIDTTKENRGFTDLTYSERIAADNADSSAEDCQLGSLNATLAAGKIILCFSKSATHKIGTAEVSVQQAGGVGLIFAQYRANGLEPCFLIPCIKVDYEVGTQILSYIRKASSPIAKLGFPKTVIGKWVSPKVASFSSRGPSSMSPSVLKPDMVAPGVDILAAYSPVGAKDSTIEYALQSGTSMACPHVAGIAALIKSVHKDWSPAAIRSALVTTASQFGTDGMNIFEEGPTHKEADPFDMGGGHVNPNKAMYPGLVYNITTQDYVQFLCSMGYNNASISNLTRKTVICLEHGINLNLNLPSITIPNLRKKATVTRTVTNVGHINSVYKAVVRAPYGITMRIEPQVLRFNKTTRVISFKVRFFSTQKNVQGDYAFGSLTWTDGENFVKSSIAIRAVKFQSYSYA